MVSPILSASLCIPPAQQRAAQIRCDVGGGSYRKAMTSTKTHRNAKLTKTLLAKYVSFTGKQPIRQPVQFSRLRNPAL